MEDRPVPEPSGGCVLAFSHTDPLTIKVQKGSAVLAFPAAEEGPVPVVQNPPIVSVAGTDITLRARDAVGAGDAVSAGEAVDAGEVVDAGEAVGARGAVGDGEAVGASEAVGAGEVVGAGEAVGAGGAVGACDAVGARNTLCTRDTLDTRGDKGCKYSCNYDGRSLHISMYYQRKKYSAQLIVGTTHCRHKSLSGQIIVGADHCRGREFSAQVIVCTNIFKNILVVNSRIREIAESASEPKGPLFLIFKCFATAWQIEEILIFVTRDILFDT